MGNDLAVFVTYAAFLVDGNMITNLLSISGKSPETGPDSPQPAIVGGTVFLKVRSLVSCSMPNY